MQSIATLTTLNILGISYIPKSSLYVHTCPVCGSDATTDKHYTYCTDKACVLSVASPVDLLAAVAGGYDKAAHIVQQKLRLPDKPCYDREAIDRDVFSWWQSKAMSRSKTTSQAITEQRIIEDGMRIPNSNFGVAILTKDDVKELQELASRTGLTGFPELEITGCILAHAVQTKANVIDAIVLTTRKGRELSFVWYDYSVGLVGLGGCRPMLSYDIHPDVTRMLKATDRDTREGRTSNMLAVHMGLGVEVPMDVTAVPNSRFVTHELYDIEPFTLWYDVCHAAAKPSAVTFHALHSVTPRQLKSLPWRNMRRAMLLHALKDKSVVGMSALADSLIDSANLEREEGARLVKHLQGEGFTLTAAQLQAKLAVRVIHENAKVRVVENLSDYAVISDGVPAPITNFALHINNNIYMPDTGDVCHAANLLFGTKSIDIVIAASCIDQPNKLQDAVRLQMLRHMSATPDNLPTIVNTQALRKYILPYLKQKIATVNSIEGVSRLGWNDMHTKFVMPGASIDMSGIHKGKSHFHPDVKTFASFDGSTEWIGQAIHELPKDLRDVLSMIVASIVRPFTRATNAPVLINNDERTRSVMKRIFAGIGQHNIIELSQSNRDLLKLPGINGFPILVSGFSVEKAYAATFPYFILTDTGYTIDNDVSDKDVVTAISVLQHAINRVVTWCLAEDAEGFKEEKALYQHSKLLREGKWLFANVCDAQPWEVSAARLQALEGLIADACAAGEEGIELHGLQLHIHGVSKHNAADVTADLDSISVPYELEDGSDTIVLPSTKIMKEITTYNGSLPKMKVQM